MNLEHYNLITERWLRVIDETGETIDVSLHELFDNAKRYRCLAGEMKTQDFVILRLLLSILQTVYTRYDADDHPYEWLEIDEKSMQVRKSDDDIFYEQGCDHLLATWKNLYQQKNFSSILNHYLETYQERFDFLGEHPFFQVTKEEYNQFVPETKQISTGKGTVAVKQLNRTISESGNSPALFAPKTTASKNDFSMPELVRWIITYQNYTGVTDKTKIKSDEKYPNSKGWVYGLNSVFTQGENLFETLLLNLILVSEEEERDGHYVIERPVWEFSNISEYISKRQKMIQPGNLAELYTAWSRILHLEWKNSLTIYSAGIPDYPKENAFIEPMTTWRKDKKVTPPVWLPATKWIKTMDKAMWQNFGQYIALDQNEASHEPGIVTWLNKLKDFNYVDRKKHLTLYSTTLVSDGNATSLSPNAEVRDDMRIRADVLFDDNHSDWWPAKIEETITMTQSVGNDYRKFISQVYSERGFDKPSEFVNQASSDFYARLNEPFKKWLSSLTNQDDRDEKIMIWKKDLKIILNQCANEFMQTISPQDIKVGNDKNIFVYYNLLHRNLKKDLKEVKN